MTSTINKKEYLAAEKKIKMYESRIFSLESYRRTFIARGDKKWTKDCDNKISKLSMKCLKQRRVVRKFDKKNKKFGESKKKIKMYESDILILVSYRRTFIEDGNDEMSKKYDRKISKLTMKWLKEGRVVDDFFSCP
jgi:hypothetical protein